MNFLISESGFPTLSMEVQAKQQVSAKTRLFYSTPRKSWKSRRSNPRSLEQKLQQESLKNVPNIAASNSKIEAVILHLPLERFTGQSFEDSEVNKRVTSVFREKVCREASVILVVLETPHHNNFATWSQQVGKMVAAFSERFGFDLFTKTINSAAYGSVLAVGYAMFTLVSSQVANKVPNSTIWYPNFEIRNQLSIESKVNELHKKIFSADKCESQYIDPAQKKLLQFFWAIKRQIWWSTLVSSNHVPQ